MSSRPGCYSLKWNFEPAEITDCKAPSLAGHEKTVHDGLPHAHQHETRWSSAPNLRRTPVRHAALALERVSLNSRIVSASDHAVDLRDLLSAVGMLLLRWGVVESQLRGAAVPDELSEVRQLRNTVCHGLYAANADPRSDIEPFVRCRSLDGADRTYTYSDLQAAIRTLERVGGSLSAQLG
jgi:hypothetical protein